MQIISVKPKRKQELLLTNYTGIWINKAKKCITPENKKINYWGMVCNEKK
jgi:hypothetical protein